MYVNLQRASPVPLDTRPGPACFWGREDKREINCSTSSPASTLLLRVQFVGGHRKGGVWKREGLAVIWRSWEILWSSFDFRLMLLSLLIEQTEYYKGRNTCQFLRVPCLLCAPVHTQEWLCDTVARNWCCLAMWHLWVLPLLFTFPFHVSCNYKQHVCGGSVALSMKWWHCRTSFSRACSHYYSVYNFWRHSWYN